MTRYDFDSTLTQISQKLYPRNGTRAKNCYSGKKNKKTENSRPGKNKTIR